MKLTKHYSFAVIFLTFFSLLFQQDITVKGKVTGENGDALVGVNIMVKGTFTGVSTNIDGEFSITVDKNAILVTSYIGYKELNITANEILNISLIKDVLNTEEIVVSGLASSVKRKNLANSVATISIRFNDVFAGDPVATMVVGLKMGITNDVYSGFDTDATSTRIYIERSFGKIGLGALNAGGEPYFTIGGLYSVMDNLNVELEYVVNQLNENLADQFNLSLTVGF
mgnify:FL=1